ncbi:hypothetical protein CAFE_20220 [Caprobacter fermentans]|uniref:Uncharacterized protein n=3 Tax=Caproicibacter fermentans TaxID=2576756 RepID=A0A6N8HZY4_9FIRM|nr:hypothetical protein [Caproicibacter fermentans]
MGGDRSDLWFFSEEREMLIDGVIVFMTEIDPKMKDRFNSLSEDLKSEIMKQNVQIRSLQDLIHCLEKIVKEG